MSEKCTIVEIIADFIYFVIIGEKDQLIELSKAFQKNDKNKTFIITKLNIPISFKHDYWENEFGKKIIFDSGIESAQSYAIAQEQFIFSSLRKKSATDGKNIVTKSKNKHIESIEDKYMLLILENNILNYPKLELNDDDDPEEIILLWLKKTYGSIPKNIKKSIKPISLVGYDDDILVYVASL